MPTILFNLSKNFPRMRADFDMERGGPLHEAVKQHARDHGIRHSRASPELLRKTLESEGYDVNHSDSE
ncbi:MAG: hypothetical protein J07HQX50_02591 [Haloquadratum sp. J07HQX50]|nr:MAG: hypothetical protein J07HQX50_02591 [Haloquadratum sp. J07HQX50]